MGTRHVIKIPKQHVILLSKLSVNWQEVNEEKNKKKNHTGVVIKKYLYVKNVGHLKPWEKKDILFLNSCDYCDHLTGHYTCTVGSGVTFTGVLYWFVVNICCPIQ